IIRSALRYADNAIAGMRSAPKEFTTADGGGAVTVAAAMWNAVGVLATATTEAPVRVPDEDDDTDASGVTAESRMGVGADARTAPAKISGERMTTPKAGLRTSRPARRRAASRAAPPLMCTQPS